MDSHSRPLATRQGAVRHGHLWFALGSGRHVGDRQGARQGDRQGERSRRLALEVAEGNIVFKDGVFTVGGTDESSASARSRSGLYVAHISTAPSRARLEGGRVLRSDQFHLPGRRHVCEVEIEPETGDPRSCAGQRSTTSATVINPMIVEGEAHGGVAQGIGQALLDRCLRHQKRSACDWLVHGLRHAARRRPAELRRRHDQDPKSSNPLGLKGCGEAGAIAAPACRPRCDHGRARPRRPTSPCR